MLILTSNGISTTELKEKIKPYLLNEHSAVIVTTASVGYKEKDWHIPRLIEELSYFRLSVDFFDFDTDKADSLLNYDVVLINGGNPFYLLKSIKVNNGIDVLTKLAKEKVIIGVSAGSIVLQNNINLIASYSPEMNDDVNLSDLTGLGLTNIQLLPHYSRFINRFDNFEERACAFEKQNNCIVQRINDGQTILDNNGVVEIF